MRAHLLRATLVLLCVVVGGFAAMGCDDTDEWERPDGSYPGGKDLASKG